MNDHLLSEAVVLAGGEGRRLGRRKESLEIGGRTLLARHLDLWCPLFERVRVSARTPLEIDLPPDVETVLDPPGAASLIDVLAHLIDRIGRPFWLVAVDLPLVPPEVPRTLFAAHTPGKCVFAEHEQGIEVLSGIYDPGCRDTIDRLRVSGERALHKIAETAPSTRLPFPAAFPTLTGAASRLGPFWNVNTPEDLERLTTVLAEEERR